MKNNNFGKTIYKLRKKHGLTQSELAARLNVSDKAVSKWENGAGDAFAAACLYALYNDYDDVHMLEFASAAAAMNLSAPDYVSGMRSKEEIEELNRRFKRRKSI